MPSLWYCCKTQRTKSKFSIFFLFFFCSVRPKEFRGDELRPVHRLVAESPLLDMAREDLLRMAEEEGREVLHQVGRPTHTNENKRKRYNSYSKKTML